MIRGGPYTDDSGGAIGDKTMVDIRSNEVSGLRGPTGQPTGEAEQALRIVDDNKRR